MKKRSHMLFANKIIPLISPLFSIDELTKRELRQLAVAIGAALALGMIILMTQGKVFFAGVLLLFSGVVILTFYRLEWGLYLFIGAVLLCDQHWIPGFQPLTFRVRYFLNIKENPHLPPMDWAVMNMLELHLLLVVFIWLLSVVFRKNEKFVHVPSWGAALLFLAWVAGAVFYGLRRGGEFLTALWEVRALFYLGIMYFFIPQVIRTKRHVEGLMWVCIAAISFKAFQGIFRFVSLGFSFQGYPTLTNHEDPLFILSLVVLFCGLVIYGAHTRQRRVLLVLLIPLLMGFVTGQRRASYGALFAGMIAFVVLLNKTERRVFMKRLLPIVVCVGLYAAVFWESNSRLASPLRLIKTGLSLDPDVAGERYYSNLYREIENYNLSVTVQRAPVFGVGFGNKYDAPIDLAAISFSLRDYIPHNEIFWLIVKMGGLGFLVFWFFLGSFLVYGSSTYMTLKDPYLRAVCAVAIVAVVGQIVVSYFDLQLTFYRNMVYLGCLMGLVGALRKINDNEPGVSTP